MQHRRRLDYDENPQTIVWWFLLIKQRLGNTLVAIARLEHYFYLLNRNDKSAREIALSL